MFVISTHLLLPHLSSHPVPNLQLGLQMSRMSNFPLIKFSLISKINFDPDESKSSETSEPRWQPLTLDMELALEFAQSPYLSRDSLIPVAKVEVDEQFSAHQLSLISEINFDLDESKSSETSEPRWQPLTLDKELSLGLARSPDPSQVGLIAAAETEAQAD